MTLLTDIDAFLDHLLEGVDLESVFLAALVEKFIPILPSYILFPAIGAGSLDVSDLLLRCLVATIGSLGGATGWYVAGSLIGPQRVRNLVERYGRWVLLKPQLYDRMAAAYRRRPFFITAAGQMIPSVRIFQALPAGVLRLPLVPFLFATAIGAQGWILPLSGAGYLLRHFGWSNLEIGVGLLVTLVSVEGLAFLLAVHATKRRRLL